MFNIWVTGAAGMLGKAVVEVAQVEGHVVLALTHHDAPIYDYFRMEELFQEMRPQVVINCAGMIPQRGPEPIDYVRTNTMGPLILADACRTYGIRLLHVSTDCVFSGRLDATQRYRPKDLPDASDLYGQSKALAETIVALDAVVIRTSFIGFEHGLLPWFVGEVQAGRSVSGYINALWTGSTVWEVARQLIMIATANEWQPHIGHLATWSVWTKFAVLRELNCSLELNATIKTSSTPKINRALASSYVLRDLADVGVRTELQTRYREWLKSRS